MKIRAPKLAYSQIETKEYERLLKRKKELEAENLMLKLRLHKALSEKPHYINEEKPVIKRLWSQLDGEK